MMTPFQKILIFFFVLYLSLQLSFAQIQFSGGNWASIKQKAKTENKHIVVDAYTTWCGPCKWMAENVFTDPAVGDFFNANFVAFKLDMEKGEGIDFAETFNIRAFPTIVYFDPNGEIIHKTVGAVDGEMFILQGKDALDPDKQLFTLKKKYDQGESKPEFLRNYALSLQSAYEDAGEVARKYLNTQKEDDLLSQENWEFIQNFSEGVSSEPFKFVMQHKEQFSEKFGEEEVSMFISRIMEDKMYEIMEQGDEEALKEYAKMLRTELPDQADRLVARLEYLFYARDPENSFQYAKKYLDNYSEEWSELNEAAWGYYETVEDKAMLEAAVGWADKSIQIEKNWYNTDTKAALLHKLGRNKEARVVAEESIKIGKSLGEDTKSTQDLLAKIKKAKK